MNPLISRSIPAATTAALAGLTYHHMTMCSAPRDALKKCMEPIDRAFVTSVIANPLNLFAPRSGASAEEHCPKEFKALKQCESHEHVGKLALATTISAFLTTCDWIRNCCR